MSSCGSKAGTETSVPLVNGIVHSQLAHQSDAASNHAYPALLYGRLVAPDFVVNWIEVRAVRRPQIRKFIKDDPTSYIIALSDWR